jgi:hypothetical protein
MSVCEDCIYKKTGSTLCNSCNERNNWYWKKTKKLRLGGTENFIMTIVGNG